MQGHRPPPNPDDVVEHALGSRDVQSSPVVVVVVRQRQAAVELDLGGGDARSAKIEFGREYRFMDGVDVA